MVAFPPTVPDIAKYGKGGKCQVNNTRIQCGSWPFAHLLGCPATNGALGMQLPRQGDGQEHDTEPCHTPLFHVLNFRQNYDDLKECPLFIKKSPAAKGSGDRHTASIFLSNLFRFQHFLELSPLLFVQNGLAKTDLFGGDFDTFILLDIFHALLQGHLDPGNYPDGIIASAGAHIGQLLSFCGVDDQVTGLDVLGDDLAYIYFFARIHKKGATILQFIN